MVDLPALLELINHRFKCAVALITACVGHRILKPPEKATRELAAPEKAAATFLRSTGHVLARLRRSLNDPHLEGEGFVLCRLKPTEGCWYCLLFSINNWTRIHTDSHL